MIRLRRIGQEFSNKLSILIKVFVLFAITVCLSGCVTFDNLDGELEGRVATNIHAVDMIYNAGLISEELATSLKDSLLANKEILLKEMESAQKTVTVSPWGDVAPRTSNLNQHIVRYVNTGDTSYPKEDDSNVKAYPLLSADDDNIKELMQVLDYNVYVLKRNPLGTGDTANDLATMDTINKAIELAIKSDDKTSSRDDTAAQSLIDAYFVKTPYKVWDTSKPENQIIKDSVSSGKTIVAKCDEDDGTPFEAINENQEHLVLVRTSTCDCNEEDDDSHPALDYACEIKINEFNMAAVERLVGAQDVNKNKYVVIGTNCYLMEYPVYYVDGFETQDNDVYSATYQKSDLKVNLLTKKLMFKDGRECIVGNKGTILSVTGNTESKYTDLGEASFIVDGIKGEPPTDGYLNLEGKAESEVLTEEVLNKFGRVVLRDYLELTYMPNVVNSEKMVALGRRLRLTRFTGSGDEVVGLFIDKAGNKVENSLSIKITDFMDISQGIEEGKKNKLKINDATEEPEETDNTIISDGVTTTDSDLAEVDGIGISHNRLLDRQLVNKIITTSRFPGDTVDTIDMIDDLSNLDNYTDVGDNSAGTTGTTENTGEQAQTQVVPDKGVKQFFYAMAVDIDPFQSNLFSGWVQAVGEDTTTGNLDWWNAWLKSASYKYQVDKNAVIDFLSGNYSLELAKNGYILLDMNTIANIQQEIDLNERIEETSKIDTLFVILGYLLLVYSILLPCAWVYDVNMIAGPRILSLITGGRWEAISSRDLAELPNLDLSGKHYMNFSSTMVASILMIFIGLLLMFVDIINILDTLIIIFGKVAEMFGDALQGIK